MTWLQCQIGTDSITHGTRGWTPNSKTWRVEVPPEVAAFMIKDGRAGVYEVEEPDEDVHVCSQCGHHHHPSKEELK